MQKGKQHFGDTPYSLMSDDSFDDSFDDSLDDSLDDAPYNLMPTRSVVAPIKTETFTIPKTKIILFCFSIFNSVIQTFWSANKIYKDNDKVLFLPKEAFIAIGTLSYAYDNFASRLNVLTTPPEKPQAEMLEKLTLTEQLCKSLYLLFLGALLELFTPLLIALEFSCVTNGTLNTLYQDSTGKYGEIRTLAEHGVAWFARMCTHTTALVAAFGIMTACLDTEDSFLTVFTNKTSLILIFGTLLGVLSSAGKVIAYERYYVDDADNNAVETLRKYKEEYNKSWTAFFRLLAKSFFLVFSAAVGCALFYRLYGTEAIKTLYKDFHIEHGEHYNPAVYYAGWIASIGSVGNAFAATHTKILKAWGNKSIWPTYPDGETPVPVRSCMAFCFAIGLLDAACTLLSGENIAVDQTDNAALTAYYMYCAGIYIVANYIPYTVSRASHGGHRFQNYLGDKPWCCCFSRVDQEPTTPDTVELGLRHSFSPNGDPLYGDASLESFRLTRTWPDLV